ncbi:lipopolysaccharide biosynthesis protein RfbH [archaeon CG07_land_8_20_14_0_80_38_8]|nr:MAG: lipopolysaccharide biosynthesis protein RfbH [archaeon CG07_land_8_20_14_0_80_38_8]PIU89541.1 MAG: lipopolysaccharide biosynthesis protein RfbH [archaeon CG06_land_8_20_14_3_00_37_11]
MDNVRKLAKEEGVFPSSDFMPGKSAIPVSGKVYDSDELCSGINAVLKGWWTEGIFTENFIKKFSSFLNVKHVIPVNSGSSANLLAFAALTSPLLGDKRIKKSDEVLTVAACFPTTVNPIIFYDCIPVFMDINIPDYNVNVELLEEAITKKTRAVFLAHTLGNPFNVKKVKELCKKHGLWLVEDCCDALGSKYGNDFAGSFGDVSTFSFYPAHHITAGEGGAVVTNNDLLNKIILSLRDWGRDCWCKTGHDNTCNKRFNQKHGSLPFGYDHKYVYSHAGFNLKWTDMQAGIACAQMDKLSDFIRKRNHNFKRLFKGLSKFGKYLILPEKEENSVPSWFGFIITVKDGVDRTELTKFLEKHKIGTRLLFAGNVTKQPYFKGVKHVVHKNLVNTDKVMNNSFWIGVYPGITDEMIDYVIEVFGEFFKKVQ